MMNEISPGSPVDATNIPQFVVAKHSKIVIDSPTVNYPCVKKMGHKLVLLLTIDVAESLRSDSTWRLRGGCADEPSPQVEGEGACCEVSI